MCYTSAIHICIHMHPVGVPSASVGKKELTRSRYDFRSKRVGVIGNGSSSIQIVPSLQPVEGVSMTVFMRSPTWISSNAFGDAAMVALGLDPAGCKSDSFTRHAVSSRSAPPPPRREQMLYTYLHLFTNRLIAIEYSGAGKA